MNPNTPQHRTIHFLTGIASCAGCGAGMLDTGQHYACPQETAQEPSHCATLPVDAARLDRMALQFLVNTLVTPGRPGPPNRAAGRRRRPGVPEPTTGPGRIPVRHLPPGPARGEPAQPGGTRGKDLPTGRCPSDGNRTGQGRDGRQGAPRPRPTGKAVLPN